MTTPTTRFAGLLVCTLLVASVGAAPAAGHGEQQAEFLVDLDASGDATVYTTLTYDLHSESEREAFRDLQGNETAQDAFAERFENRMAAVAADASDATGREMGVADAEVEIVETQDAGLMTLSVTWEGLAAVDGDRLTLTEPFSSGFDPGMAFTVAVPEGYEVVSATPEPSDSLQTKATWDQNASLEGFELVTEPSADEETSGDDGTDGVGAGFGVVATIVALLVGVLGAVRLAAQRRSVGT